MPKTTVKKKPRSSGSARRAAAGGSGGAGGARMAGAIAGGGGGAGGGQWTFLSNHAHVLICLVEDPGARLRDMAVRVGITERAVQNIIQDLEQGEVITRMREGRRNRYEVHADQPLRHPVESHRTVADLLALARPKTMPKTP
ncbi:MAG: winged helix-turn-helix domain-containing protein [Phycisphaeraceae bacterium]